MVKRYCKSAAAPLLQPPLAARRTTRPCFSASGLVRNSPMTSPLFGQMMDVPLLVSSLLSHASRHFSDTEIVSRRIEGDIHRYTYRDCEKRAKQLAQALIGLDIKPGERIGTLAWNGYRHLECYYGTTGIGAVCHTINPRLFPEQIAFIINHANDRF